MYEMTLTETLADLGYAHHPVGHGIHAITLGDEVVFRGRAHDTWAWLRTLKQAERGLPEISARAGKEHSQTKMIV